MNYISQGALFAVSQQIEKKAIAEKKERLRRSKMQMRFSEAAPKRFSYLS